MWDGVYLGAGSIANATGTDGVAPGTVSVANANITAAGDIVGDQPAYRLGERGG